MVLRLFFHFLLLTSGPQVAVSRYPFPWPVISWLYTSASIFHNSGLRVLFFILHWRLTPSQSSSMWSYRNVAHAIPFRVAILLSSTSPKWTSTPAGVGPLELLSSPSMPFRWPNRSLSSFCESHQGVRRSDVGVNRNWSWYYRCSASILSLLGPAT